MTGKNNNRSSSSRATSKDKLHETIERKAYELYEKRGGTAGNEVADWFEAEKLVKQRSRRD